MLLLALAFLVWIASGFGALALRARPAAAARLGQYGALAGCLLAFAAALASQAGWDGEPLVLEGAFPGGRIELAFDPLSAYFALIVAGVGAVSSTFGGAYLRLHAPERAPAPSWAHFGALMGAMVAVLAARNGYALLVAWESMALLSGLLVLFRGEEATVQGAGWLYLAASQLGALCVVAFIATLGAAAGSLEFGSLSAALRPEDPRTGVLFALAFVGFGAKAGLFPFHVWLPEAHPAAPSHVSALMSGAMVSLGLYGLLRALSWLGPAPIVWGAALIAGGLLTLLIGVLYGLSQRDMKRALAFSTVDNMGLAIVGIGVAVVASSAGALPVAGLAVVGVLLHAASHGAAKSLLFLAAGSVSARAHGVNLDRLGGLLRRMPQTGGAALVASASLAGLPPFAGFAGELLIIAAAFTGGLTLAGPTALFLVVAAGGAALGGALAAAAALRTFGAAFLGAPRSPGAASAKEAPSPMAGSVLALAAVLLALGALAPEWAQAAASAAAPLAAAGLVPTGAALASPLAVMEGARAPLLLFAAVACALALLRRAAEARSPRASGPTWDCGFAAPDPRMQYTASSLSAPLSAYFARLAPRPLERPAIEGPFPAPSRLEDRAPDAVLFSGYLPFFAFLRGLLLPVLRLQNGRVQAYVLYVVAALIVLILWRLA